MPGVKKEARKGLAIPNAPTDLAGAIRYAGWIIAQVARGNLSPEEAKVMTDAVKVFKDLLAVRDEDAKLAAAKKMLDEMRAMKGERS
jgi:hypothetical protein